MGRVFVGRWLVVAWGGLLWLVGGLAEGQTDTRTGSQMRVRWAPDAYLEHERGVSGDGDLVGGGQLGLELAVVCVGGGISIIYNKCIKVPVRYVESKDKRTKCAIFLHIMYLKLSA